MTKRPMWHVASKRSAINAMVYGFSAVPLCGSTGEACFGLDTFTNPIWTHERCPACSIAAFTNPDSVAQTREELHVAAAKEYNENHGFSRGIGSSSRRRRKA